MTLDVIDLTRQLIAYDTVNPPGNEQACSEHLGRLLSGAGFDVQYHEMGPQRPSLVARLGGGSGKPLCLTGHLDTVPLGSAPWSMDPFAGESREGRLYGRGSSDMKAGVAAIAAAALAETEAAQGGPGVELVFTAGEETGCEGAAHLAANGLLGSAGAVVVAEPTANRPYVGHKGALWFVARTSGITAQGSMPEKGINAIHKAAEAVAKLKEFEFNEARHLVMGPPTLNVGTIRGGININSVPDFAEIGVDIRTVPGIDHRRLLEQMASYLGENVEVTVLMDVGPIWTDPMDPWVLQVFEVVGRVTGVPPAVETATFFTDAAALTKAYRYAPTVILGPGEASQAHMTDEWCATAKIVEAVEIYRQLIRLWCLS
jgi:succinyl-diaminopimelate desuccinylase